MDTLDQHDEPRVLRKFLPRTWLALFVLFFVLYALTANRGAQWQDSGLHILRIVTGETINPRGLALSHPLHHFLGRLVVRQGLLEPCFAITLLSSLAGALAVATVFGCVWTATRRVGAGLFAACTFGIAHTVWQMATVTEVYPLTAAILAGECWALAAFFRERRRAYLWTALALNGLGLANHNLALLTLPVLAMVVIQAGRRRELSVREMMIGGFLWIVGTLPFTWLVFGELVHGTSWGATLSSALFGHDYRDQVLNASLSWRHIWISAQFVGINFPNLLLPAAAVGILTRSCVSSGFHRSVVAALFMHAVFAFRYPIVDQHLFFLPTYVLLAVLAGVGFAHWQNLRLGRMRSRLLWLSVCLTVVTPLLYAFLPAITRQQQVLAEVARNKPYRDDYVYMFAPWSIVDNSAELMSRQALALAGERGLVVVEDSMAEPAIRYRLFRAHYPDVVIERNWSNGLVARAASENRRIVLVPANVKTPPPATSKGHWRPAGELYVLEMD